MIQSFFDEFRTKESRKPRTPSEAGTVLIAVSKENMVQNAEHNYFQKGLGKLLHLTRWSRLDVQNSVRELSRQGAGHHQKRHT